MEMARSFIAIELTAFIQKRIENAIQEIKKDIPDVFRWAPPKNIHLTLKFLGNVPNTNIVTLSQMLNSQVNRRKSFDLRIGNIGVFPGMNKPRIIWIGVDAPKELFEIQLGIETETAKSGFKSENRAFHPHLTIGRIKRDISHQKISLAAANIADLQIGILGTMTVESIHLFQSELKPTGAEYKSLFSAGLIS
ncbi:MAG: RNA 2',3'-cyclic phosphodiesterase [Anaerolineaceae bacterium]|nr:RNA 2',3'-cyclic phosphodiesterase [Anaerolineaceae bacterium]